MNEAIKENKYNRFADIMRCDFEIMIGNNLRKMLVLFNKNKVSEDEVYRIVDSGPVVWENDDRLIVMTPEQFENVFG